MKRDFAALLAGGEGDRRQVAALADLLERLTALDPDRCAAHVSPSGEGLEFRVEGFQCESQILKEGKARRCWVSV